MRIAKTVKLIQNVAIFDSLFFKIRVYTRYVALFFGYLREICLSYATTTGRSSWLYRKGGGSGGYGGGEGWQLKFALKNILIVFFS